jgi:universal stress protein E
MDAHGGRARGLPGMAMGAWSRMMVSHDASLTEPVRASMRTNAGQLRNCAVPAIYADCERTYGVFRIASRGAECKDDLPFYTGARVIAAIRNILVAVKDPASRALPAVGKAAKLAKAFNARLDLFHGISEPVVADTYLYGNGEFAKFRRETRSRYLEQLEALATPLRKQGLDVRVHADWDFPAHEAIVRHARRQKSDLIVAECHQGRRTAPWLLHLTDWELLRTSPVSVLLVKSGAAWEDLNVLAAIDPTHVFAKPAKLDSRILSTAAVFAKALKGTLHVMHSYVPVPVGSVPMMGGASALTIQQIAQGSAARAKEGFRKAVADCGLPGSRLHLTQGMPADAIAQVASEIQSGVVVMGAIARSGLKRVLIGNTAERVLNALRCDVLVVKPAQFKAPVSRRRNGMRFVGLPRAGLAV